MIFWPCWVTNQMGPTFSVISMRPSGRKARRHGRLKVATVFIVKGRLDSGFCSPALTWDQTVAAARVSSNAAFANSIFMVISPRFSSARSYAIQARFAKRIRGDSALGCNSQHEGDHESCGQSDIPYALTS